MEPTSVIFAIALGCLALQAALQAALCLFSCLLYLFGLQHPARVLSAEEKEIQLKRAGKQLIDTKTEFTMKKGFWISTNKAGKGRKKEVRRPLRLLSAEEKEIQLKRAESLLLDTNKQTKMKKKQHKASKLKYASDLVKSNKMLKGTEGIPKFAVGSVEQGPKALAEQALVVDGATRFLVVPTLPQYENARQYLQKIAEEFLPIIRRRGYHVRSVSEFYGEGQKDEQDGLYYELGGSSRSVRHGTKIAGHEQSDVAGYNRVAYNKYNNNNAAVSGILGSNNLDDHTIHLRLRNPKNPEEFFPYQEVVETMAHELAHCIHKHHGDSFYGLMAEILIEHAKLKADPRHKKEEKQLHCCECEGGFNPFVSSTSRLAAT